MAAAFLAACASGAVLAVFACIPDLPPVGSTPSEASVDAPIVQESAPPPASPKCGDGIIQLDRGEECDPGGNVPADAADDVTSAGCNRKCEFVCPGFLWSQNNHCYTLDVRQAAALDEQASVYCQDIGVNAHVVTLASEDELTAVVGALNPGDFWVGFEPALSGSNAYTSLALFEPGWSPTCPGCFAHTDNPTSPLPGAAAGTGCVEALPDAAAWQQYPCSAAPKIGVVCEREPTGLLTQRCDAGVCIDLPSTHPQKRYVYVATKLGGDGAEAACETLGGTLVVLESRDEREQLWYALERMGGTPGEFWIGMAQQQNGVWAWADDAGADAYPSPWGNKQPDGNGSRAYLLQQTAVDPTPLDTTLAHNALDVVSAKLTFVCQVPAIDGGF